MISADYVQIARPRAERPAARRISASRARRIRAGSRRSDRRRSARTPTATARRSAAARSEYNALILGGRRRLSHGVDFTGSYTLSRGNSTIGTAGDELNTANIQDPNNPFDDPRQLGPNRRPTRATGSPRQRDVPAAGRLPRRADLHLPLGAAGVPRRRPGPEPRRRASDIPAKAFAFDRFDAETGAVTFKDIGACETINCGRGSQSAAEPARLEDVPPRRTRAHRSDRRDLQPVQRHQPERASRRIAV